MDGEAHFAIHFVWQKVISLPCLKQSKIGQRDLNQGSKKRQLQSAPLQQAANKEKAQTHYY